MYLYLMGVDLGQAQDPTAISISERMGKKYELRHLERPGLQTPYPKVVSRITELMNKPPLRRQIHCVVDLTGVGRPVYDMLMESFKKANVRTNNLTGITITAGHEVTVSPEGFNVPKKDLVSNLLILAQGDRFSVSPRLSLANVFRLELENFRAKINTSGSTGFEAWRESDHDDLILSVAIALWYAERKGGGSFYSQGQGQGQQSKCLEAVLAGAKWAKRRIR